MTERRPVPFNKFGGLRLDLPLDEIGGEQAQYLRDVDWDGNTGRLRPRDGFQKLKATDATGPYKALFAHSNLRLLATKRIKSSEVKVVAIDKDGEEKAEHAWPETAATFCATRFGTPSASYTYCRANLSTAKVVRFDGTTFTEPTCSVDGVTGKEMPRGKFMVAWPDGGDRLIVANTGATGGPGGAASSNSHVWFSEAEGKSEAYESTAYLQLSPGDGEEITAMAVFAGQVFIFKETKFFVVYGISIDEEGRPIFNYREVSLGEGSRMKRPVVEALAESSDQLACVGANGVYFCTSDGVWVTTGSTPVKISQALRPLEEVSPFDGPMAEFLNGETEVFRWPATGIACLGTRLIVRRYEFMFILDIPTGEWTCWKMPAVSMAIWTGLTGGGGETKGERFPGEAADVTLTGGVEWSAPERVKVLDESFTKAETFNTPTYTDYLVVTDFGLDAIPSGSALVGVEVALWGGEGGGAGDPANFVKDREIRLVVGGKMMGANRAKETKWGKLSTFLPTGEKRVYGGVSDLWELAGVLTPAGIVESDFGVAVAADITAQTKATSANVNAIAVIVYYVASSGVRPRLFCTQSKSIFVTQPGAADDAGTREAEWQSGFYTMGSRDEKDLVGVRAFGSGTIDAQSFSDFDTSPSVSEAHLEFPASGNRSVLDDNGLTDSGVMFSHKLKLEPGSSIQSIDRYLRETRTPETKGR